MLTKLYRLLRYDWPVHFILLLTNWLPDNTVFLRLRGKLVKSFLGSCGSNLRLGRNITFYNPALIHIGCNVYIAYGCWFMGGAQITIGDGVLFGPYCIVVSSNHTRLNGSFRYGPPYKSPIVVGNGSWLAGHVTLTAGSQLGNGVLVAAGAVVKDHFPSHIMIGGVPARVIKEYNDD
jgi:acetyltransferase-like isoleucine patch superfamily enzyme